MDAEAQAKKFTELRHELIAAYAIVVDLLASLPIPMRLPWRQADDPVWALHALARAWELAEWEPVSEYAVGRVRDMITAWTTAYELAVMADQGGPAAWRLRGMEAELDRVRLMARIAERHLSGRAGTGYPDRADW